MYATAEQAKNNVTDFVSFYKKRSPAAAAVNSPVNSRGITKAKRADAIRNYEDFKKMAGFLISKGRMRDFALIAIGFGTGLRASDIVALKVSDVISPVTREFKPDIDIYEKKTGKRTNTRMDCVVVTDVIKDAVWKYLESIGWDIQGDDFLLKSKNPKRGTDDYSLCPESVWRIVSTLAKDVGLPLHVGSHTMRRSFLQIAATLGSSSTMNANGGLLNEIKSLARHSNSSTTEQYLPDTRAKCMSLRVGVSNFLLGRTRIKDVSVGYNIEMGEDE